MKYLVLLILLISFVFATVDINKASVKELTKLKGVATKKAELIVAYRSTDCFKTVDEIVKVKGLGKNFLEENRDNMKAGTCKK